MRRTKVVVSVLASVALTAAATGCSGSANDKGSGGGAGGGGGDTLTVGAYNGPTVQENFNPFSPNALTGTGGLIYEGLFDFNVLEGGKFHPWLATKYKISRDGKTVTVFLDKRAKWADGSKLTAEDVVFSYEYRKKNKLLGFEYESVKELNANAVELSFKTSAATLLGPIGGVTVIPKKIWEGKKPTVGTNKNPMGSGPYKVSVFTPQQVTFGARDDWWKGKAGVPKLAYKVCGEQTLQELIRGDLQWTACGVADPLKNFAAEDKKLNHVFKANYAMNFLSLNTEKKPFDNVDVRRGIQLALSQQGIADSWNPGMNGPISPTGLDAKAWDGWLPTEYQKPVSQDKDKALAAFKKAGYSVKGGKLVKGGKQLSLKITEVAAYKDAIAVDKGIVNQLKKIGIDASVAPIPENQWNVDVPKGKFEAVAKGVAYGGQTPYTMYNQLLGKVNIGVASARNYGRWNDKATEAALKEFSQASTPDAQKAANQKLEKIMVDQVPVIPTMTNNGALLYSTRNFTGWPDAKDPYTLSAPWGSAVGIAELMTRLKPVGGK